MDTSTARCNSMTISRNVLRSKPESTVLTMLLLVWRLHMQLCQLLAKFIPSFFVSCGSRLTNRRVITMRSSAWRRRLAARLLHGVGPARSALTRTPLARPLLMPLSHAAGYTFLCTVQLRQHVVKLAMSSAECFMHGVAHASHRSTLHPAPPRPIVIEGDGAHSVALSAHSTCTGASGVADVVADGTHTAGGVAAAEWICSHWICKICCRR